MIFAKKNWYFLYIANLAIYNLAIIWLICFISMSLKLYYPQESQRNHVKMQILILWFWMGSWNSACLTSSQEEPILLLSGPHLGYQSSLWYAYYVSSICYAIKTCLISYKRLIFIETEHSLNDIELKINLLHSWKK